MHGPHNFVVAGAAAEVSGQPVADPFLAGILVAVEQSLGSDQNSGGAITTLQGLLFNKSSLKRMEATPVSKALHSLYLLAFDLHAEHKAGVYKLPVHQNAAGAAVPVVAARLGAGETQYIPQALQQALMRLTEKLHFLTVDCGADSYLITQRALL